MKVNLELGEPFENTASAYGMRWFVSTLIKATDDCKEFDLRLDSLDLSVNPWGPASIYSMAIHVKRMDRASLQYPVIQAPDGWILDGWHRILKALVDGKETVRVRRLKVLPESDFPIEN